MFIENEENELCDVDFGFYEGRAYLCSEIIYSIVKSVNSHLVDSFRKASIPACFESASSRGLSEVIVFKACGLFGYVSIPTSASIFGDFESSPFLVKLFDRTAVECDFTLNEVSSLPLTMFNILYAGKDKDEKKENIRLSCVDFRGEGFELLLDELIRSA